MCNTKESNKAYQMRLGTWQVALTLTLTQTLTLTSSGVRRGGVRPRQPMGCSLRDGRRARASLCAIDPLRSDYPGAAPVGAPGGGGGGVVKTG